VEYERRIAIIDNGWEHSSQNTYFVDITGYDEEAAVATIIAYLDRDHCQDATPAGSLLAVVSGVWHFEPTTPGLLMDPMWFGDHAMDDPDDEGYQLLEERARGIATELVAEWRRLYPEGDRFVDRWPFVRQAAKRWGV